VHPWSKRIFYSIFCVFALLPQKKLKRKYAAIYSILSISKKREGGQCSWRLVWATPWKILVFFRRHGSDGPRFWGAPHHRPPVAPGRSWRHCQGTRVKTAEPNFRFHSRTNHVALTARCTLFTQRQKVCRAPHSSQKKAHVISSHPIANLQLFTNVAKSNNHIEAKRKYKQQLQ